MPNMEAVTVSFKGAMTIQSIDAARIRMIKAFAESDLIEIDCASVDEVDFCFVQMLLAARLGGAQMGKRVRLAAPASGALLAALERGGFIPSSTQVAPFWAGE